MKKKGYAKGGAMKKKGYAKGGAMKKKPVAMKKGSKLKMVEKGGKKVPFFAADGVGKMKDGGTTKPKKRPASMVKPKPRPGSKNGITKETLVGSMTKADVEKAIDRGKNPKKKPRPTAPSKRPTAPSKTARKAPSKSRESTPASKKLGKAVSTAAKFLSPITGAGIAGAAAKKATKKMGGGMMKKKGMAKGGAMKKKGYAKGGSVARGSGAARPQKFTRNG